MKTKLDKQNPMVSHNQEVKYHNKDEKGHSYD